jgi:hypothetical protein
MLVVVSQVKDGQCDYSGCGWGEHDRGKLHRSQIPAVCGGEGGAALEDVFSSKNRNLRFFPFLANSDLANSDPVSFSQ